MKQGDLMREVEAVIDARIANKESAALTWVIQAVMNRHQNISGDDKDFFLLCGREHIHATVRGVLRAIRKEEDEPEVDAQQSFPGYKRLQRRYAIERDSQQMVVPLEQVTDDEGRRKVVELRAIGVGALAHAQELEDYLNGRAVQAA